MNKQSLRIENWELRNTPLSRSTKRQTLSCRTITQFSFFNSQFSILLPS